MTPDPYWDQVRKEIETVQSTEAAKRAMVYGMVRNQTKQRAARSRDLYRSRIRRDGKVLCLKCRKYRAPSQFWISHGTYLNRCKPCSNEHLKTLRSSLDTPW